MNEKIAASGASELDELCINTIRFLSVDAIERARSGHPGMPLGAAPMAYVLWTRFLKHNPSDPGWFDRDRFILSAGHGSMLLYSLLHLTGYALPLDQVRQFRQWGSLAPGHPERGVVPGVEVTTGPLGQGFANGVGMAVAEAYLAARYNRPGFNVIDHFTYGIVSDGDLMEGIASEAASLAGRLGLGKLIYLYDSNRVTLASSTDVTFTENTAKRFDAYGWHTQTVKDGNDLRAIHNAMSRARKEADRPSLIVVNTHIGYGSPHKQDSFESHGSPLGADEVKLTKQRLGWPVEPAFYVPEEAGIHLRSAVDRGGAKERAWESLLEEYAAAFPEPARELAMIMKGGLPEGWDMDIPSFPPDPKGAATRVTSGKIIDILANRLPGLIGGSCDLNPSTHTVLKGKGDFGNPKLAPVDGQGTVGAAWSFGGRNVHFGVREHAMGAMLNGMAAHGGILPFGSTFLIFSDYIRPSIRLAALTGLKVIYVFTHDSIGVGEDGPTHQPIEQLASLRAIPGLTVIRPCDANETAQAWRVAIETRDRPVALVLSRQSLPVITPPHTGDDGGLGKGAYILSDAENGRPDIILIATGSEVGLAVRARETLQARGVHARVVSMPSWDLFERQTAAYKDLVLPPGVRARLTIEAGSTQGWLRFAGEKGGSLGIDRFGASAPGDILMREYGFTVDNVCARAVEIVKAAGTE